jgi:signal transduction histidine kinase
LNNSADQIRQLQGLLGDRDDQLQLALEAANLGTWHWTSGSDVFECCERTRRLLRIAVDTPLSLESFVTLVHSDDRFRVRSTISTARHCNTAFSLEYRIRDADGRIRWLHSMGRAMKCSPFGDHFRVSGVLREITQSRQASEVLDTQRQCLQELMQETPVGVAKLDRNLRFLSINQIFDDRVQVGNQPIVGRSIDEVFEQLPQQWRDGAQSCLDGVAIIARAEPFAPFAGSEDRLQGHIYPWFDDGNDVGGILLMLEMQDNHERRQASAPPAPYVVAAPDMTEHMRDRAANAGYGARLRSMAQHFEQLRELERNEIAGTLQWDVCTAVSRLHAELLALAQNMESPGADRAAISELIKGSEHALECLRHLIFDLTPPGIGELGLEAALERFIAEHAARSGLQITLRMPQGPWPANQLVSGILYSVAQEAIGNAIEHARATRVDVVMEARADMVRLRVADNGIGLGETDRDKPGRFGLFAAAERLARIGGTLRAMGVAGQGSTVEAAAPPDARLRAEFLP